MISICGVIHFQGVQRSKVKDEEATDQSRPWSKYCVLNAPWEKQQQYNNNNNNNNKQQQQYNNNNNNKQQQHQQHQQQHQQQQQQHVGLIDFIRCFLLF